MTACWPCRVGGTPTCPAAATRPSSARNGSSACPQQVEGRRRPRRLTRPRASPCPPSMRTTTIPASPATCGARSTRSTSRRASASSARSRSPTATTHGRPRPTIAVAATTSVCSTGRVRSTGPQAWRSKREAAGVRGGRAGRGRPAALGPAAPTPGPAGAGLGGAPRAGQGCPTAPPIPPPRPSTTVESPVVLRWIADRCVPDRTLRFDRYRPLCAGDLWVAFSPWGVGGQGQWTSRWWSRPDENTPRAVPG